MIISISEYSCKLNIFFNGKLYYKLIINNIYYNTLYFIINKYTIPHTNIPNTILLNIIIHS